MGTKLFIVIFIVLNLMPVEAKYIKNKKWFKNENLTRSIYLEINGEKLDLDKDTEKIIKYFHTKPYDYYFLPKKHNVSQLEKECAINLKKNIYHLRSKDKPVVLPNNLTWKENPFNDRNWVFWFHNWKFSTCLLDGYRAFNDQWYINRMKWLVKDWFQDNFKSEYPSKEFSWYDHTIPIRLHHMLQIFEFIRREKALDVDFTKVALRSIYWHARILAEDENIYFKHHNHGLDQSMKLFEASQVLPEYVLAGKWEEISRKRLKNEITFALTSEGIHKENSPGYHPWVSVYCAQINNFSEHYTGEPITNTDSKSLQDGGLHFITAIAKPDNTLPQLGDTSPNKKININYPLQKNLSWYPYYQYVISHGHKGKIPKETTSIFKESGYFIYRDKWDKPDENNATQLILKCGFLAKGHRNNDDGNILLYAFGEDWLIDAGTYGYEYNKYRTYVESPSAHNISLPYGVKMSPPSDKEKITTLEERFAKFPNNWGILDANTSYAMCESHMYRGFTYRRELKIIGKRSFALKDTLLSDNNTTEQNYLTLFKFPDDKEIYIQQNKNIVLVVNKSKSIALAIHYIGNFSDIKLFSGESGDIMSLETESWLKMKSAKTLTFIYKGLNYTANFKLEFIRPPMIKDYKKLYPPSFFK